MGKSSRTLIQSIFAAALACLPIAIASGTVHKSRRSTDTLNLGLIHRWQFNGDAIDCVGTLSSLPIGPVVFTDVDNGEGIVFNGSSTGVNVQPVADTQFQASFSITVWANLYARPSGSNMWSAIIFDGDDRPGLDPFALQADPNGKIQFLITGASGATGACEAPMPLNKFVHLTATYDKPTGVQSFYENGKLVSQNKGMRNLTPVCALDKNSKPGIGIGAGNNFQSSSYHFGWKGVISDLRIYNRALSAEEAQGLFNLGVTKPTRVRSKVIDPTP